MHIVALLSKTAACPCRLGDLLQPGQAAGVELVQDFFEISAQLRRRCVHRPKVMQEFIQLHPAVAHIKDMASGTVKVQDLVGFASHGALLFLSGEEILPVNAISHVVPSSRSS